MLPRRRRSFWPDAGLVCSHLYSRPAAPDWPLFCTPSIGLNSLSLGPAFVCLLPACCGTRPARSGRSFRLARTVAGCGRPAAGSRPAAADSRLRHYPDLIIYADYLNKRRFRYRIDWPSVGSSAVWCYSHPGAVSFCFPFPFRFRSPASVVFVNSNWHFGYSVGHRYCYWHCLSAAGSASIGLGSRRCC